MLTKEGREFKSIIFERLENVAAIRLNRPETFNALDFILGEELIEALESCFDDEEIKAVIITGEGRAFCSGGDLKFFKGYLGTDPAEPFRQLTKLLNRIIMDIRLLSKPIIAAINGSVGGAGMSIAAACDLRIAASSARFRQAYTGVGLVPDGGWTLTVPLLIGFAKATELVLLDPVLDARQALELGLVHQVVEDAELRGVSMEIASRLARGPTKSFAIAKELFNNALLGLLERQLELERAGIVKAAKTADYQEGIKAFFEKRRPGFTGR